MLRNATLAGFGKISRAYVFIATYYIVKNYVHFSVGSRRGPESGTGKRDRSDIVKLGGPADVRAIFNRARHFDFGPPYRGRPVGR